MKTFGIIKLTFVALLLGGCEDKPVITDIKSSTEVVAGIATSTFKVWGNCGMCKETIENSLKLDGIIKADWNTETKIINVSYDTAKINLDYIQKNIALVGYDNEKYKGNGKAYSGLPDCCQYERKP